MDPGPQNQHSVPESFEQSDSVLRLVRLETPSTDTERKAFEIMNSKPVWKRRIGIQLLEDDGDEPIGRLIAKNEDFVEVSVSQERGRWQINFRLTYEAGQRMKRFTTANTGKRMGIFIDGKLVTSPRIMGAISTRGVIEGDFTKEEAESIADGIVPKLMFGGKEIKRLSFAPARQPEAEKPLRVKRIDK